MSDYFDLLTRKEALHPELEPYVTAGPLSGLPMLHHPLIIQIAAFQPDHAGWINKHYEFKKEQREKYREENDWEGFVFIHERPYRFEAFLEVAKHLEEKRYWELVGHVWVDSENIYQGLKPWKKIWGRNTPGKEHTMDKAELEFLKNLPDEIEVWRGTHFKKSARGLSWTLDKEKAIWFASRYLGKNRKPYVAAGTIKKQDVHAVFLGRGENEVVASKVVIADIELVKK